MMALSSRWSVLALLCVVRLSVGVNFQTPSALAPFVIAAALMGGILGAVLWPGLHARWGALALLAVAISLPRGL